MLFHACKNSSPSFISSASKSWEKSWTDTLGGPRQWKGSSCHDRNTKLRKDMQINVRRKPTHKFFYFKACLLQNAVYCRPFPQCGRYITHNLPDHIYYYLVGIQHKKYVIYPMYKDGVLPLERISFISFRSYRSLIHHFDKLKVYCYVYSLLTTDARHTVMWRLLSERTTVATCVYFCRLKISTLTYTLNTIIPRIASAFQRVKLYKEKYFFSRFLQITKEKGIK